jgi:hypothetical protein
MSASLETVRRLNAWAVGAPLPRGNVINLHVANDEDLFIVAFLRMGGESRPWGVAYGTIADGPTVLTVPEGRNRTLVGDMMAAFAPAILSHFRHPSYSEDGPQAYSTDSLRQIWLPSTSHIEMLHFIAAAYARSTWDRPDIATLNALGNLANCLFIESQRPGQQTIVAATDALRNSYVFPAAPVRQAHLGYLLGWLNGGTDRDTRLAAARVAERLSMSTVLDPHIERTDLQPLVSAWGEARAANNSSSMNHCSDAIHSSLSDELLSRWSLAREAAESVRNDTRAINAGVDSLVTNTASSFFYSWGEKAANEEAGIDAFWPNVFTDYSPRSAGSAYQLRDALDNAARRALIHGDTELQQAELVAGHGVICQVVAVDAATSTWTLHYSFPDLPTIKRRDKLAIAGHATLTLEILEIDFDSHTLQVKPKWVKPKANAGQYALSAVSPEWKSKHLVLVGDVIPFSMEMKKVKKVRERKATGSDITDLIVARPRRHAALDDDGPVVANGDDQ